MNWTFKCLLFSKDVWKFVGTDVGPSGAAVGVEAGVGGVDGAGVGVGVGVCSTNPIFVLRSGEGAMA